MDFGVYSGELTAADQDLVAFAVFEHERRTPDLVGCDRALGNAIAAAARDERFEGRDKQVLVLNTLGRLRCKRVALLGMGKRAALNEAALVALGTRLSRLGREVGATQALLVLADNDLTPSVAALVVRGAVFGSYRFDRYRSEKNKKAPLQKFALRGYAPKSTPGLRAAMARATVVADAVAFARDLVNESPLELYPETLAARAKTAARVAGLEAKVLLPTDLERRGMRLLLGVGAGSSRGPRLVHLIYRAPKRRRRPPLVLVGKGITFDSGGLCLKPAASMEDMKSDMAGAAAVLATLTAVAALAPDDEIHGILALAENMPSGTAIRPGDVIQSAAGKTVEVTNTDAEGRLVLADALHYARSLSPRAIIDVATLTGACAVALGPTVGLFSNDDALAARVLAAAKTAGESFWRLPLTAELKDQLKSEIADMRNSGAREGGAITAALFLREFAQETPWVHLDIAGAAMAKGRGETRGASGVAVATLVEVVAP